MQHASTSKDLFAVDGPRICLDLRWFNRSAYHPTPHQRRCENRRDALLWHLQIMLWSRGTPDPASGASTRCARI